MDKVIIGWILGAIAVGVCATMGGDWSMAGSLAVAIFLIVCAFVFANALTSSTVVLAMGALSKKDTAMHMAAIPASVVALWLIFQGPFSQYQINHSMHTWDLGLYLTLLLMSFAAVMGGIVGLVVAVPSFTDSDAARNKRASGKSGDVEEI